MTMHFKAGWQDLPDDVLHLIYAHLSHRDLAALQRVSRLIQQQVIPSRIPPFCHHAQTAFTPLSYQIHSIGWPSILSRNSLSHVTLLPRQTKWPARLLFRHNLLSLRSIEGHRFLARQIGREWEKGCMPVMILEQDRMVVAAGSKLLVHDLGTKRTFKGNQILGITEFQTASQPTARDDITGLFKLPSGQYIISTIRGNLLRFALPPPTGEAYTYRSSRAVNTAHYPHPGNNAIETLSGDGSTILSAAHDGLISLFSASSPWIPPNTTQISDRPWSSLLSMNGSSPFAAIGTTSINPLQLYPILPTGIDTTSPTILSGPTKRSAVYSIANPPHTMTMPYTNSPSSLLLSAWFDGHARLHDLRSPSRSGAVMEWSDPWSDTSLYSVTFAGMGCVVGGAGRHGLIHLWDPRMGHKSGWSAFVPGRPESPTYDLKGEGSRVWGVSSNSAFVLSFDITGEEGEVDSQGWDVVPLNLRARNFPPRWNVRSGRGGREMKDFATGYRHEDRSLKLFDSLGDEDVRFAH